MINFVTIPIMLYFFKINLILVFTILSLIDLIRMRNLFLKNISAESITMYQNKNGMYCWLPRNQWFFNGIREFIFMEFACLAILPIRIIYKVILMACYYNFINLQTIIISSLYLTGFTMLGEIIGAIIAIKQIINSAEKHQKNVINDYFGINTFQKNNEKKSSEVFKDVDKFVFYIVLSSWVCMMLLIFLSIAFDNEKIFNFINYIPYPFGFIIFVRFLNDKYFKFLYYIGFFIVTSIVNKFFVVISSYFMNELYGIVLFILVYGFASSYIIGYLFEFFKQKSYSKYKYMENS